MPRFRTEKLSDASPQFVEGISYPNFSQRLVVKPMPRLMPSFRLVLSNRSLLVTSGHVERLTENRSTLKLRDKKKPHVSFYAYMGLATFR